MLLNRNVDVYENYGRDQCFTCLGLSKSCLSQLFCLIAVCRDGNMDYSMRRDQNNPHWNNLFRHVKELNDKLLSIANFYLCEDLTGSVKNEKILSKATSNISDACLEVTDATCVVVATMRSIIRKEIMDTKTDAANCAPSHKNIMERHDKKKESDECVGYRFLVFAFFRISEKYICNTRGL